MKNYLKKNISLIFKIFLYMSPILDLLTSIMINYFNISFTIGMITRFIFLLFIVIYYLFIDIKNRKDKLKNSVVGFVFIIVYLSLILVYKDINVFRYEFEWLVKIIYFVVLLIYIDKKDIKIEIDDFVNIGLIYLILIAIPNFLNISLNSYTQGKVGSVGLFNSGNEISAIISILNPILVYYIFNNKDVIKELALLILMFYTYFAMGSKIVIISLVISIIYNLIKRFKGKNIKNRSIVIFGIILITSIVLGVKILPKTNFYYNISLHLKFLEINNVSDVFTYKFVNRFVFSDRLTYLNNTKDIYMNSSVVQKLFGIGFVNNYSSDGLNIKMIEMDFCDIFFRLGLIGFLIVVYYLYKNIKLIDDKLIKFSVLLGLLISMLVGHTLVAPSVSIILIYMIKYNQKVTR